MLNIDLKLHCRLFTYVFLTAVIVLSFAHVCSAAGFTYLRMDNITIFHPLPSKRIISQFSAPRGLRGRDLLVTSDDFSQDVKERVILSMFETRPSQSYPCLKHQSVSTIGLDQNHHPNEGNNLADDCLVIHLL